MTDAATGILWVVGSSFAFLAALGVLRMPDVFTRMQASTKASTLGLGCLLIGTALQFADLASVIRVVSIAAFTFLTTPVAAHVIARASYRADIPLWDGTVLDERQLDPGTTDRSTVLPRDEGADGVDAAPSEPS